MDAPTPSERRRGRAEPVLLALLVVAASLLATRYAFLDRRDRGLWWGDVHYNLLRAYYVLKGYDLYDDVPSGQFPGLQTLLALLLLPLGYGGVRPSTQTFEAMQRASIFLAGAVQAPLYYLTFRAARATSSTSFLLALFTVYYLWEMHGHYYALVETILVPTVALMVCLLSVLFTADRGDRARAGLQLLGVLLFAGILGLTIAPAVALWTVVAMAIVVPALGATFAESRDGNRLHPVGEISGWSALLPLGAATLFLAWTLASIGLRTMYFWTVGVPSEDLGLSLWKNLWLALMPPSAGWFHFAPSVGSEVAPSSPEATVLYFPHAAHPQFALLLLVLYVALRYQRADTLGRPARAAVALLGFAATVTIGYLLMGWRYPGLIFDEKKLPQLGVTIGLLALLTGLLAPDAGRRRFPRLDRPAFRAASWAVAALLCIGAAWPYRAPAKTSPRDAVLDEAGICRLGEFPPRCRCLVQASYDPRAFLVYDVQPCLGYSPEQPPMLQHSRRSRELFERGIGEDGIAFFMGNTKDAVTIWDIPPQSYDRIVASRECLPFDTYFRICYRDAPPRAVRRGAP